jgi:hypothetical protein
MRKKKGKNSYIVEVLHLKRLIEGDTALPSVSALRLHLVDKHLDLYLALIVLLVELVQLGYHLVVILATITEDAILLLHLQVHLALLDLPKQFMAVLLQSSYL